MQPPELFLPDLTIAPPADAREPRLWIRRLVIWERLGDEPLRDIPLRPGLNIVWTPDDSGIGHGGGKTLLCRLLRYCLGEDQFAPEEQRERISKALPDAWVGAEVVLDGTCWAVLRPLGVRRKHFAVRGGSLEALVQGDATATGMDGLLSAIEQTILTPTVKCLVDGQNASGHRAWQIALAWLSRDQECRFDDVLDWRSSVSNSESPARGLNKTEKLEALRAFLGGIDPAEQALRRKLAQLTERRQRHEQELGHRHWEIRRLRQQLVDALSVPEPDRIEGDLGVAILRDAAQKRWSDTTQTMDLDGLPDFDSAREAHEQAQARLAQVTAEIDKLNALRPVHEHAVAFIEREFPALAYAVQEAENFPCPVCNVPISRVLASQCGLSDKIPDAQACRERFDVRKKDLEGEKEKLRQVKAELERLKPELALAKQDAERKEQHYRRLDQLRTQRHKDWYAAQRLLDDVEKLADLLRQRQLAEEQLHRTQSDLEQHSGRIGQLLQQNAAAFSRLHDKFDPIVRRLVGVEAKGEVHLTGKGLELRVQMGGDRSTSAIDSLKVVAFDLAALCLSIEGLTRVPAFLIHDSPREADLGLSLYHRLFHLVHELEQASGLPLFQYIVTTTTEPPESYAQAPWLALTLRGAPASERLLRRDL